MTKIFLYLHIRWIGKKHSITTRTQLENKWGDSQNCRVNKLFVFIARPVIVPCSTRHTVPELSAVYVQMTFDLKI